MKHKNHFTSLAKAESIAESLNFDEETYVYYIKEHKLKTKPTWYSIHKLSKKAFYKKVFDIAFRVC